MPKKFIDAEKCIEEFMTAVYDILSDDEDNLRANQIIDTFDDLPAADVQEVKHGKWQFAGDGIIECSICEETYTVTALLPRNFCPNCGARMDGDGE